MKKRLLFAVLLTAMCLSLSAQIQRGLKESFVLDSFPKVSFVWNTANPELMDKSHFALFEEDSPVDFIFTEQYVDNTKPVNKSILFLWEDMYSHGNQFFFTRDMLTRFFREISIASTDRFEVAVFDRQNDNENTIIKPLVGQFTSDNYRLNDVITSYQRNLHEYVYFPQHSELFRAIEEGISMLKKEVGRTGVIVLVTAGFEINGNEAEMEDVCNKAREAGIPIYVVKYPFVVRYPLTDGASVISTLANKTNGQVISSSTKASMATDNLKRSYLELDSRLRGRDYQFTFISKCDRDGKQHPIRLNVDNETQLQTSYTAPLFTFGQWMAEKWWLVALVVILVACCIVLVVVLAQKNRKERDKANQEKLDELNRKQEENYRRNREENEKLRKELEAKEKNARSAQKAVNNDRLAQLMDANNLHPRLSCKAGNETFNYSINKPRVTLGRNADNDVAFTMNNASFRNKTVSGLHAEIVFNGSTFEVINKSHTYKDGVVVNGRLYKRYALRNGDMIGLGEAIITFYC